MIFRRNYFMKIKTLAAVILSTLAISTAYAADETMPATGDNMAPAASASGKAEETAAPAKKHKKHTKKHKKHHCAETAAADTTMAPSK